MRAHRRFALITGTVVAALLGGLTTAPAQAAPITTAPAVAVPTGVTVKTSSRAVDLAWRPSTTAAVSAYSVRYRATGASAWSAARITTTRSVHIGALSNGTRYELTIRAEASTASSAWTTPVSGVPGARAGVVASLRVLRFGARDTEIAWTRPTDTGGRAIGGYDVRYRRTSTAAWHPVTRTKASAVTVRADLGSSAQVQVRAVTTRGTGAWSALTAPTPTVDGVAAPASLSASGARGVVNLRWAASPGATAYLVRFRAAKAASWTSTVVAGTRVALTHLRADTKVRFAVAAQTAAGISRFSPSRVAAAGRVPSHAPRALRAGSGDGSVALDWARPTSGPAKTYEVRSRAIGTSSWSRPVRTSKRSLVVRRLTDGRAYAFVVRVAGRHPGPWSMTAQATPSARAAAPAAVTAKLESATSALHVAWAAPSSGPAATGYDVRYRAANATGWTTVAATTADTSRSLAGLAGGTSYRLQVRARTAVGGGAWSAETTAYVPGFSLPIVDISTGGGAPITNTDDYVASTVSIASKTDPTQDFTGTAGVKGHGNSTWPLPKKPYKIKLDAKAGLLGMPTNKHWVLLANYKDRSQLRNDVALYLGKQTSLAWTPDSRFVELVLNGQYEGLYELTEQVRVDSDRVAIDALSSKDKSATAITGGYLLERDGNRDLATEVGFDTATGHEPITVKDPEAPTAAQLAYIQGYVDDFESALYSDHRGDPDSGYAKYIDLDSFVDWYIVEELVENSDAWFSSAFMYKARGGKLTMGPLWDFDLSTMNAGVTKGMATSWYVKNLGWWAQLAKDPAFEQRVAERWQVLKPRFDTVYARIDAQRATIASAAAQDGQLWSYSTHDYHLAAMTTLLRTREAWLSTQWKAAP